MSRSADLHHQRNSDVRLTSDIEIPPSPTNSEWEREFEYLTPPNSAGENVAKATAVGQRPNCESFGQRFLVSPISKDGRVIIAREKRKWCLTRSKFNRDIRVIASTEAEKEGYPEEIRIGLAKTFTPKGHAIDLRKKSKQAVRKNEPIRFSRHLESARESNLYYGDMRKRKVWVLEYPDKTFVCNQAVHQEICKELGIDTFHDLDQAYPAMQTVGGGEDVGEENLHDSAVGAVSTAPLDPPSPRGKKRKRPDATPYDKKPRLQPANIAERRASPSPEEQLRKEEEEQLRKEEEEQLRKDEEEQLRKDEEEQLRKDEEEQLRKEEDQRRKQRRQEDEDQPCGATLPHACADDQRYSNRPTIRKRKRGSSPEPSHGPKKVKAVEVSETLASTQLGRMSQNSAAPAGARQKPSGAPDDNERPSNRSKKGGKRKFSSIQPHKLSPVPKKRVTEGNRLPGPYATLPLEDEMNWEPTKPARKIRKATRRHERLRFAATRSKQGNQGHKLSSLASGLVPPSPPRTMETTMRSDCTAEGTPTVEERGTRVIARELHGGVPYLLVKDDAGLSIIREDECANHAKCNYDREFVPKNHKDELSAIAYKGRDIFKTKVKAVYLVKGHTDLKLNIWYFDLVEKKDRIRCDEKTAIVLMDSLNLCDFDSLSRYLAQTTPARSSHQRPKDRTWDRRQQIRFGETSSQVESSSMNQSQRRASSPASQPGLRATRSPAQRESDRKKDRELPIHPCTTRTQVNSSPVNQILRTTAINPSQKSDPDRPRSCKQTKRLSEIQSKLSVGSQNLRKTDVNFSYASDPGTSNCRATRTPRKRSQNEHTPNQKRPVRSSRTSTGIDASSIDKVLHDKKNILSQNPDAEGTRTLRKRRSGNHHASQQKQPMKISESSAEVHSFSIGKVSRNRDIVTSQKLDAKKRDWKQTSVKGIQIKPSPVSKVSHEPKIIASQKVDADEQRDKSDKRCLVLHPEKGNYSLLTWEKLSKRYPSMADCTPPARLLFGKDHQVHANRIKERCKRKRLEFKDQVEIITTLLYPSQPHKFLVLYTVKDEKLRKNLNLPNLLLGARSTFEDEKMVMNSLQRDTKKAEICWQNWRTKESQKS